MSDNFLAGSAAFQTVFMFYTGRGLHAYEYAAKNATGTPTAGFKSRLQADFNQGE